MVDWYEPYDNAYTSLSGAFLADATTLVVADATALHGDNPVFPYLLTLWDFDTYWNPGDDAGFETVKVTNAAGNTLTVERGILGTNGNHDSGERAAVLPTSLHWKQITDEVDLKATAGAIGSSGLTMATGTFLGRTTAGTGAIEELEMAANVATFLATPSSANLATAVTDETGSGALVFATSPTLVMPNLGVATATSLNVGSPATPSTGYIYAKMFGAYVSGGYGQVKIGSWNDTPGFGSAFTMFRARGTYASPTYGSDADVIGNWYFNSLNTAGGEQAGAAVRVYLDGAPAASYVPMGMQIQTYDAGGTYATRLQITGYGSIVCGRQAALATNATDGFLYVPTCAGTPSGTPTSFTGKCALVYDSTNNKLYVYDGGWVQVALSA